VLIEGTESEKNTQEIVLFVAFFLFGYIEREREHTHNNFILVPPTIQE